MRSEYVANRELKAGVTPAPVSVAFRDTRTAARRHAEFYEVRGIVKDAQRARRHVPAQSVPMMTWPAVAALALVAAVMLAALS